MYALRPVERVFKNVQGGSPTGTVRRHASLTTQPAGSLHPRVHPHNSHLASAPDDALVILSGSPFFIPSLVVLLADLSTALWEVDPELMASLELLSECVSQRPLP
jgi:hypothetical protein